MLPLKDVNPTRNRALVTMVLIAVCVVIYFFIQPGGKASVVNRSESPRAAQADDVRFTFEHAAIPCEVVRSRPLTVEDLETDSCAADPESRALFPNKSVYFALLYSMFLHGSILHIAGNMLFLWIFGNNIEDRFGIIPYIVFYLVAGVVATMAHVLVDPSSVIPLVGTSGAVAGVMGVYLVLFPSVRIKTLFFLGFFIFFRDISAKWLLGFWLISQFFISAGSGVAWVAHVGGFVFGVGVGIVYRMVAGGPPASRYEPVYGGY